MPVAQCAIINPRASRASSSGLTFSFLHSHNLPSRSVLCRFGLTEGDLDKCGGGTQATSHRRRSWADGGSSSQNTEAELGAVGELHNSANVLGQFAVILLISCRLSACLRLARKQCVRFCTMHTSRVLTAHLLLAEWYLEPREQRSRWGYRPVCKVANAVAYRICLRLTGSLQFSCFVHNSGVVAGNLQRTMAVHCPVSFTLWRHGGRPSSIGFLLWHVVDLQILQFEGKDGPAIRFPRRKLRHRLQFQTATY